MNAKDLFFFNKFITPTVITFLYWLMLLGVVLAGIGTMFGGYEGFTFKNFMTGLMVIVFGGITVRIYLEIIMVIFKINSNLQKIADNSEKKEEE